MFLGLRYELAGAWHEKGDILGNFSPEDGGHHVVPNAEVAALLPPGLQALGRTQIASAIGLPDTLINTDKNNFSPRVGFAWRVGGNDKTVLRGGFGLFHPDRGDPGPAGPAWPRTCSATRATRSGPPLQQWVQRGRRQPWTPTDFGSQGIDPNLQSPDIYQYNLTLERELPGDLGLRVSYIGSTMRKLLIDPDLQHAARQHDAIRSRRTPTTGPGCPSRCTATTWATRRTAETASSTPAQLELQRRWKDGLALNVAYTYAHSDSNAPDSGNSSLGVILYDTYNLEADRGPDPNVVKHRLVAERHLGHPGRTRDARTARACRGGRTRSSAAGRYRRCSRPAAATT